MQLVPSNIVQVKDDKALKPAIENMSAIINEQTLFKHLPMDNIQSELNIWYSMWCRHKLEGTRYFIFFLFVGYIITIN